MVGQKKEKIRLLKLLRIKLRLVMPPKMRAFLNKKRYKFAWGGRGGGKSKSICKILLWLANKIKLRILCVREIQNSIAESVYSDLKETAQELGYTEYEFKKDEILNRKTKSVFKFKGLYREEIKQSIKSFSNFDIIWNEEAQATSAGSLKILIPTIRKSGSELWFSFNRLLPDDPIWKLKQKIPSDKKTEVFINIDDNDYVSQELIDEYEIDKNLYEEGLNDDFLHVWMGDPYSYSDKAIFKAKEISDATNRKIKGDGGKSVGVDVGRFGKDLTVFFMRKGLKIIKWESYKITSVDEVCDHLVNFVKNDTSIPLKIDDTGVGGGVTDFMKRYGFNAIGVNNGSRSSRPDKHDNMISEMWFYLKSIIDEVNLPDIPDLRNQLLTREYYYDKKERRCIESKEKYKTRTKLKSPDFADALLLCFLNIQKRKHRFTRGIM